MRRYRVFVPAGYASDRPMPIVLVFHGHGGSPTEIERTTGFSTLATQHHFLAVYPEGLPFGPGGGSFWASAGPVDFGIDERSFVNTLLDALEKTFCIAPRRIYATGFSNGGGMAGFLACRLATRIAAFAPVSGNFYALPGGCNPHRAVPIMDIHGTVDRVVPYSGISARENPQWPLPSIPQWLLGWVVRDRCIKKPVILFQKSGVVGERWIGCRDNAAVIHYRLRAGHVWPSAIGGTSVADVFWRFFQQHSLAPHPPVGA